MPSGRRWIPLVVAAALLALVAGHAAGGATAPTRWIVFAAHPNGVGDAQLFRVQVDGQGLKQITTGGAPASAPAFSPNGRRIAFVRLGSGIFTVGVDGTGLRRLTRNARDSFPVYSPNGKSIAFIRPFKTNWRVYVMSSTGRGARLLRLSPPAGRPTWTPDGKGMFIPAGGDLVRIDARTGRPITYYGIALDLQVGQTATVSPNARKIAFVGPRVSTGPPDCGEGPCPQFGLYMGNVPRPHRVRRIVNDTGPAGWSSDSRAIVYVARGALTLRTVATGARTSIASGDHVATGDAPPAWQPR
jgi:WD40-like Beta Propeller Repeat